jgi:hypothetical protein
MHSTPQPPTAAGEHFADAERILAALPFVKRGADAARDDSAGGSRGVRGLRQQRNT